MGLNMKEGDFCDNLTTHKARIHDVMTMANLEFIRVHSQPKIEECTVQEDVPPSTPMSDI